MIEPRISFFVALGSEGEAYFSLTQVNTDANVKMLFLSELAATLDLEHPSWRTDTRILMDNAGYNTADETLEHIQRLRMPAIFSGPYSYDAAAVEYFFSYFKKGRVMPESEPSGK